MPEIVSQIHRPFIVVNHVNCLCLTTELSESKAAGLPRIFCVSRLGIDMFARARHSDFCCSCTFDFKDVSSHFDFQDVQETSVHAGVF